MPKPDFQKSLNEAARVLDAPGLPDATERRIRARLNGEAPRRRTLHLGRVGLLAAGAACAVAVAVFALRSAPPGQERLGGFALVAPSADFQAGSAGDDRVEVTRGRCTLNDEWLGASVAVAGPAKLRRLPDGVEVASGAVELEVDPAVQRAGPYRVRVSHGVIEVLGTHFTVTQREDGGEVSLQRGSIRFRGDDGRVVLLAPGGSLSWPLAQAAVAPAPLTPPAATPEALAPPGPVAPPGKPAPIAVRAPAPKPELVAPAVPIAPEPPAAAKVDDPEELLNRIAVLRSRGQYEEAAAALVAALKDEHPASTRERLSYELGAILTRQVGDRTRACAHWQGHLAAFPGGRYAREVARAREDLGCPPVP